MERLSKDDIQIISANMVPISIKYGGSNNSNCKIMVKLESHDQRNKLFVILKRLRHAERWNKVFINPDFTVKERKMHFELRQQSK